MKFGCCEPPLTGQDIGYAPTDTPHIKHDLMADHVPHETCLLRATADGLRTHPAPPPVIFNAYIEAFAIHARSLINFFNGKDGCHAVDFTVNYVPFANGKIEERLERKLNAQIPHITEHLPILLQQQCRRLRLPGACVTSAYGGQGVLWTNNCPRPTPGWNSTSAAATLIDLRKFPRLSGRHVKSVRYLRAAAENHGVPFGTPG